VDKVKKSESGMIHDPVTVHPDDNVGKVLALMTEFRISGLPVVRGDKLVGIVTNRDVRFVTDNNTPVSEVMTSRNLITVPEGISDEEAKRQLHQNRIEKLLVVDDENQLKGLITIKDIEKVKNTPTPARTTRAACAWARPWAWARTASPAPRRFCAPGSTSSCSIPPTGIPAIF
jgi:FOG: CBS domain